MRRNKTQLQQIKGQLLVDKEVTSWRMINLFRITRLAEYIRILRAEGWNIKSERIYPKNSNWYVKYTLKD